MTDNVAQTPTCEHYWAWVSPAGTSNAARICSFCHQPDPEWLNTIYEIDLSPIAVSKHVRGLIPDLFGKHYEVLGKAGQPLAA